MAMSYGYKLIHNLNNKDMKTLKSIVLGLALLVVTSVVKADEPSTVMLTRNHAVNTYIKAMTQGINNDLNDVLDQTAKFSTLRGNKVVSFDKEEMMTFAKQNENVSQACTTTVTEVQSNADVSVVKVDMHFGNFTRTNYVTMANTGNGWKITNVYSVFK
jgi:tRNA U55 pseudouridine synthase TruB